jgi:hypothetical protein
MQIKNMGKHYCSSTGKLEKNCMANQFWVRDQVLPLLVETPTLGAAALLKELEKKYLIKLSYNIVWNGRKLALDELNGKWDDAFAHAFAYKAELEKRSPGSVVEIQTELIGSKMRFSKFFVAFKACIDGFLTGCRPYLRIDSTVLTST